ncbi:hypothetical protein [Anaerocolumna jejuensis]|uniref:hypothetical protein n=1 Tax=Anaerocolumna jejuensis TaxID=259063 RepID=UPI003F7BCFD3
MNISLKPYKDYKSAEVKSSGSTIKEALDKYRETLQASQAKTKEANKDYEDRIYQKLNAGKRLTSNELDYLRTNNPEMYMKAIRLQMKRDAVESCLKNCKSKKEVEDVAGLQLGAISEKDPDREAMINTVNDAIKEFKKTDQYKRLPEDIKEEEKGQDKQKSDGYDYQGGLLNSNIRDFDIKL